MYEMAFTLSERKGLTAAFGGEAENLNLPDKIFIEHDPLQRLNTT